MSEEINDKIKLYFELNKELTSYRKKQLEYKKKIQELENDIQEFMQQNSMDSICRKEGQISCYDRKISQTFKRESMIENVNNLIKDEQKAEKLVESIISNKIFKTEKKLKVKLKN